MIKAEWGLKRTCQSCGTRFYDMGRHPIACPRCAARFDPEAVLKSKRTTKAVAERAVPAPVPVAEVSEPASDEEPAAAEESEEEEVIEDSSELGDDQDVADVIENVDEDEER